MIGIHFIHFNHLYSLFFRCNRYQKKEPSEKCNGRASINTLTSRLTVTKPHSHDADVEEVQLVDLKSKLLEAATNSHGETSLRRIYDRVCAGHPAASKLTFAMIENSMYRRKHKDHPKIPKTIEELVQSCRAHPDSYGKYFKDDVVVDGETVAAIFSHPELQENLEEAEYVCKDATFQKVCKPFYQQLTLWFKKGENIFPGMTIFMKGKKQKWYEAAFRKVKEIIPNFDPKEGNGDFEKGLRNAAQKIFSSLRLRGCFFHYNQAIFKKVQKLGFQRKYAKSEQFRRWVKLLMHVPLLPSDLIRVTFEELLGNNFVFFRGNNANFTSFKNYIRKTWMNGVDPDVLSVFGTENTTNNSGESYHAWNNAFIGTNHPNPWELLTKFNEIMDIKALDLRRHLENPGLINVSRPRNNHNQSIYDLRRQAELDFQNGVLATPIEFLETVSTFSDEQIANMSQTRRDRDNDSDSENDIEEVDPLQIQPEEEEAQAVDTHRNCKICLGFAQENYIFLNCGHGYFCEPCSLQCVNMGLRCPTCRGHISRRLRVFIG